MKAKLSHDPCTIFNHRYNHGLYLLVRHDENDVLVATEKNHG